MYAPPVGMRELVLVVAITLIVVAIGYLLRLGAGPRVPARSAGGGGGGGGGGPGTRERETKGARGERERSARREATPPASSQAASAKGGTSGAATPKRQEAKTTKPSVERPTADGPQASAKSTEKARAKSKPSTSALPKMEFEEDEELDPTRVGKQKESAAIRPPISQIVFDEGADLDIREADKAAFVLYAKAQTDTGLRRKRNEDSYLILDASHLFVVADGMGGYNGGEIASKLAVETITHAFKTRHFDADPHEGIPAEASELARSIQMANTAILDRANADAKLTGMGTTVCAARFSPKTKRLFLAHVGDSRCYRLRDGVLTQITVDHTMADFGVSGPESAHLSRAVGIWPTVPIDIVFTKPELGDTYLICSDGLTKMLPDNMIGTVIRHEEDPEEALERLVFFANSRGGKDNTTIILVRVVDGAWKPPPKQIRKSRPDL